MKKYAFVLILGSLATLPALAAIENVTWDATAGMRYFFKEMDDGLEAKNNITGRDTSVQHTKSMGYRAAIAAQGKANRQLVDWRFGVRTKRTANSDYVYFQQNADFSLGIESSWLRYRAPVLGTDLAITLGRQTGSFEFERYSENLFSESTRFDGLGWMIERGIFSFGMGQYSLGALSQGTKGGSTYTTTDHLNAGGTTGSSMAFLCTFQPSVKFHLSDTVASHFAVGFYHWSHTDSFYTNTLHGGVTSLSSGATTGTLSVDNARQLQVYNSWELPFDTKLSGEWIKNLADANFPSSGTAANKTAWVAAVQFGNAVRYHGAQASYGYLEKGLGSVVGDLSSEQIPPDNKGHIIALAYEIFEGTLLNGRGIFLDEMSHAQSNGIATTNRQNHKTTLWELSTNINF